MDPVGIYVIFCVQKEKDRGIVVSGFLLPW